MDLPERSTTLRQRALRAGIWTVASYGVELSTRLLSNLMMTPAAVSRGVWDDGRGDGAHHRPSVIKRLRREGRHYPEPARKQQFRISADLDVPCSANFLLWSVLALSCALLQLPSVHSLLPTTSVFADPSFPIVATILGLSLVLAGFELTNLPLNIRHLNFRPIVAVDLISRIVPLPIMIAWAYAFPTVWSIVAGTLLGGLLRVVCPMS